MRGKRDSLGQFGTITVWDSLGQFGTVWDSLGQFGTVWDNYSLGQFGTVWDNKCYDLTGETIAWEKVVNIVLFPATRLRLECC